MENYSTVLPELEMMTKNSQVMMDLSEDEGMEEQKLYESAHVDDMLSTSFIELDHMAEKFTEGEYNNFNSGSSFFHKANHLFLTEMGNTNYKRMKNKKLQCDIGSGKVHEEVNASVLLYRKQRRLQILKIIKLVKLIFSDIRTFQQRIKKEISKQKKSNKKIVETLMLDLNQINSKYAEALGNRDLKILQLQQQINRIEEMNERLIFQKESQQKASKKLIQEIQQHKIKSLAQIKDASIEANQKAEEIEQENRSLEEQISFFQLEIDNLQEICNNRDVYIKKLEYENQKLQKQNYFLQSKQQKIISEYQQRDQQYNEVSLELQNLNEEILKLQKINDLYQKQLQSSKMQTRRLEGVNNQIMNETENIIFSELQRYQQQFNEEIQKLKRHNFLQISSKELQIDNLKKAVDRYLSQASKENIQVNSNTILNRIDTNSSRNSIKYESEEESINFTASASQYYIPKFTISYQQINSVKEPQRTEGKLKEITFSSTIQPQSNRGKIKSTNNIGILSKKPLVIDKKSNGQNYIFKAKEPLNQKLKLSKCLQQKQKNIFSASDGHQANYQLNKMQTKLTKLNQNLDKHFLKKQRK